MSVYMTEEEQLQAIKKWWKQYNGVILTVLSIILLIVAGYRYWNWYKDSQKAQASTAYEHMMVALSNKDNKVVKAYANQLIQNHNHTVYSDIAHLTLAKLLIAKDNYDKANNELATVASESSMPALKQVAKLRMARVLAMKKQYNEALKTLSVVEDMAYLITINELKGDIYAMNGEYKEAISCYKLAMDEAKTHNMGNLFLEMKTNELQAKA
jgi:predicted negative regulator of RcsB-dependent stress response